jgi:hypothetical protein
MGWDWTAWLNSPKRKSRHSNDTFLTRKDRRIHDRQFLGPRRQRKDGHAVKTFEEQERHDNPGHPANMYLGRK